MISLIWSIILAPSQVYTNSRRQTRHQTLFLKDQPTKRPRSHRKSILRSRFVTSFAVLLYWYEFGLKQIKAMQISTPVDLVIFQNSTASKGKSSLGRFDIFNISGS